MGWAHCGTDSQGREIGYGIQASCDHEGCEVEIDRGLAYACGADHGEADVGGDVWCCEKYFCDEHLYFYFDSGKFLCEECTKISERHEKCVKYPEITFEHGEYSPIRWLEITIEYLERLDAQTRGDSPTLENWIAIREALEEAREIIPPHPSYQPKLRKVYGEE